MRVFHFLVLALCAVVLLAAAGPNERRERDGGRAGAGGGASVEFAEVPDYLCNVVLGCSGPDSIVASVLAWKDLEGYVAYDERPDALTSRTAVVQLASGQPRHLAIGGSRTR